MIGPNQNPKVPRKTQITTVLSQAIETIMQWKSADKWDPMKKADSPKCHKISSRQSLGQDQLILTARASGFSRDLIVMFLTPSTIIILETLGTVTVTSVMTTAGLWSQSVVPGQGEACFSLLLILLVPGLPGHGTPGRGPGPRSGGLTSLVARVRDIPRQGSLTETSQGEKSSTQTLNGFRLWMI